jgi:hypothetical protein
MTNAEKAEMFARSLARKKAILAERETYVATLKEDIRTMEELLSVLQRAEKSGDHAAPHALTESQIRHVDEIFSRPRPEPGSEAPVGLPPGPPNPPRPAVRRDWA